MWAGLPRRAAVSLAVLLMFTAGCTSGGTGGKPDTSSGGKARHVPLEVVEHGPQTFAFVPISIAGHRPVLFALDTGASFSAIDKDLAAEFGLKPTGERVTVSGVGGTQRAPLVDVPRWQMGDVRLDPAKITAIDLDIPRDGQSLRGLLGSDILSDFGRVTIDYDRERLDLPAGGR